MDKPTIALAALFALLLQNAPDKLSKELIDLRAEYKAAQNEFLKPLNDAKTPEAKKRVKLDAAKDPAKKYLPKFAALASKAKGSETGLSATMDQLNAMVSLANGGYVESPAKATPATPEMEKLIDGAFANYGNANYFVPFIGLAAQTLRGEKANAFYEKVVAKSTSAPVRGEARFSIAQRALNMAGKDELKRKEAYDMLALVAKETPDTSTGKRAAAIVFEHEKLQEGMPVPDFAAKDQDGKDFKLSDFRGKVVLLDFWGFW